MASNFDAHAPQDAIDALGRDRARLAEQMSTPRWYHPVVGLLAAAAAISPGLPVVVGDMTWTVSVIAGFVILIVVMPLLTRKSGIATSIRPAGRTTKTLLVAQVGTLIVLMVLSGLVSKLDWSGWWLLPIGLGAWAGMWLLGVAYDRAYRAELTAKDPS